MFFLRTVNKQIEFIFVILWPWRGGYWHPLGISSLFSYHLLSASCFNVWTVQTQIVCTPPSP